MRTLSILSSSILLASCISTTTIESESKGTVRNGELKNGHRFKYHNQNFSYFSTLSYYLLNNAYTNSKVKKTVEEAYQSLYQKFPDQKWKMMECSNKKGGKMRFHRTHQNGTSIDFMVPLLNTKSNQQSRSRDHYGMWHYLLKFDKNGFVNGSNKTQIDFEKMAHHILALKEAGVKNGVKIKKVIFKIELKANLFNSAIGKKLKSSGIYFAQALSPIVNNVHDDHYHIDFEI